MNAALKWFLVIGIIAVTFILPVVLQTVTENRNRANLTQNASEIETSPTPSPIVIKSIPPASVIAGSDFTYRIAVDTNPEQDFVAVVTDKPEWLNWDSEQNILTGKVPNTAGTFVSSITVTTLSGYSAVQKITVIITKQDAEVQGATTTMSSFDPFHPEVSTANEIEPTEIIPTEIMPTAVWQLQNDSFADVGTTPVISQVLGESSERSEIRVDYLLYGASALLLLSIGYLLARVFSNDKRVVRKTSSGVVIQSVRS